MPATYEARVDGEPRAALAHLAREAEAWGGRYDAASGRLELPVLAGLRRGWLDGTVHAEPAADAAAGGARLVYRVTDSVYRVQPLPFFLLLVAGLGALLVVVAPFEPRLLRFLPAGAMAALAGWLFVVATLRNSGPEELLAAVADAVADLGSDRDGDRDGAYGERTDPGRR